MDPVVWTGEKTLTGTIVVYHSIPDSMVLLKLHRCGVSEGVTAVCRAVNSGSGRTTYCYYYVCVLYVQYKTQTAHPVFRDAAD